MHDALAPHHDKDFRYLAAFGMTTLASVILHVWVVNDGGSLREELVVGPQAGAGASHAYLLIHRMHARAFRPPRASRGPDFLHPHSIGRSILFVHRDPVSLSVLMLIAPASFTTGVIRT